MSGGNSLSVIVREYFDYVAKDSSKTPQEKMLGILGAAVKFTHQATQTGDQETLQYLLNETYVKDFALAINYSDKKIILPAKAADTASITLESLISKHNINATEYYSISQSLRMIFPKNKDSHGFYQKILTDRKKQNLGRASELIYETQCDIRTTYLITGKNIPRFLKLLIEKYGDNYLPWKDHPPKYLGLLRDIMQISSQSKKELKLQPLSKGIERLVEFASQDQAKQQTFFAKYKIDKETKYRLVDILGKLFPEGKGEEFAKKQGRFQKLYQKIIQKDEFKKFIIESPGGQRNYRFVLGKNVPLFLQKAIQYIDWSGVLPQSFVNDLANYNPTDEKIKLLFVNKEEIRKLSPIIRHEVLAEVYGIERSWVAAISAERGEELKFIDRVAHSEDRIDYALELYKTNNQKVRDIIRAHVFNHTANDLAGFASEKLEDYVNPWIGLYVEVFGHDQAIDVIKEKVRELSSRKVLELILNELVNLQDLPQSVLGEAFTITSWLDHKLRQYTSTLVPQKLTDCFEEAINCLDRQEQEILRMRYGERLNLIKNGYKKPLFKDIGEALGIHETVACNKESSAIEKLRQPELSPKIINFLSNLIQHFNNYDNPILEKELAK